MRVSKEFQEQPIQIGELGVVIQEAIINYMKTNPDLTYTELNIALCEAMRRNLYHVLSDEL